MVNLKTKSDKHLLDNEKRQKSLKEREKSKLNQSLIIKQALSASALNGSSSKKIVFKDENDDADANGSENARNGKNVLFGDSSSEDEDFDIKEKSQFSGEKGFELLNLQSTYGNDERFKIDERFMEEKKEKEEEDGEEADPEKVDFKHEKANQLKILESILGQPVLTSTLDKKAKKRTYEMVRYDASNKEHEKYEIKPEKDIKTLSKRKKERKKNERSIRENEAKPQVSKEKFYQVSQDIKISFKEKEAETGQFSLLQTYGQSEVADEDGDMKKQDEEMEEDYNEIETDRGECIDWSREMKTSKVEPVEEKKKTEEKVAVAQGIWKETFFFRPDDPRYKEGLEFINQKNSEEAVSALENYDKTRKKLREILRLHMKKQLQRKDPFKTKIGGMSKKQLANLKSKNSRNNFNRKKPHKMNPTLNF